ncbi:sialate O-acetylesterase [Mucilaginibacter sp. PAMB04168]|uniref:sialate O-acetylesterase n=1 Tax=Mucilaginibacter sp. PAMB04168 TaxID=3138567 RepID=UPI0031F656AB
MTKKLKVFFVLAVLPLLCLANVRLPRLVSDGMVIQRNQKVHLWGWATPGETVTVWFNRQVVKQNTAANGRWDIYLQPMQAGGPHTLTVKGQNTITINDVLIGDVWLCSGQSNMEYQLYKSATYFPDDIARAGTYKIREFDVKNSYTMQPQLNAVGSWKQANPATVVNFSAVAYFFAQSLYEVYKVPIGIIHSSYPGSPAEAWVSEEGLAAFPHYLQKAQPYHDSVYTQSVLAQNRKTTARWMAEVNNKDAGLQNGRAVWSSKPDTTGWKTMRVPGYIEDYGSADQDGVFWLKKTVSLPAAMLDKPVFLEMGLIADIDSTYINGTCIGSKDNRYLVRRYPVPQGVLKAGQNTIVIRVINKEGPGGVVPGKQYRLGNEKGYVDITGEWVYKMGYATTGFPSKTLTRVEFTPAIQFNSRIRPLAGYTIKGATWYQGESNTSKASEYNELLSALIKNWRNKWQQGNFPFLIVQLANHMVPPVVPKASDWAMLREAQFKTAQSVPGCGMSVSIDAGETYDVHPYNKKVVGHRLALVARQVAYGENITVSGPVYQSMQNQGNKIILRFNNSAMGLVAQNGPLKQFAIAGADHIFHWANAQIQNNKILVWSADVAKPVAVRYAWADNPEGCNLYNKAHLPAVPFRTDNWSN